MRTIYLLLTLFVITMHSAGFAQTTDNQSLRSSFTHPYKWSNQPSVEPPTLTGHRKSVFVEFGGNGLGISANYDVRFKAGQNDGLGLRSGVGIAGKIVTFPIALSYIIGKRRSGFETGIGVTPIFAPRSERYSISYIQDGLKKFDAGILLNFGYRLQSYNGFMLRANASVMHLDHYFFFGWPGLSIGYSFNKK